MNWTCAIKLIFFIFFKWQLWILLKSSRIISLLERCYFALVVAVVFAVAWLKPWSVMVQKLSSLVERKPMGDKKSTFSFSLVTIAILNWKRLLKKCVLPQVVKSCKCFSVFCSRLDWITTFSIQSCSCWCTQTRPSWECSGKDNWKVWTYRLLDQWCSWQLFGSFQQLVLQCIPHCHWNWFVGHFQSYQGYSSSS